MTEQKDKYTWLNDFFNRSLNTRILGATKSVLMCNVQKLGYEGSILVFKKTNLSDFRKGQYIANNWVVADTLMNPAGKGDGFVICQKLK